MAINEQKAKKVDAALPDLQEAQLGSEVKAGQDYGVVVIQVAVTTDIGTTAQSITIPFDIYLIDVIVQATAAAASSTIQLRRSTTAITDAIACATDHAVTRAGSIDDAERDLLTTESINLIAAGTNKGSVRANVFLIGVRK